MVVVMMMMVVVVPLPTHPACPNRSSFKVFNLLLYIHACATTGRGKQLLIQHGRLLFSALAAILPSVHVVTIHVVVK